MKDIPTNHRVIQTCRHPEGRRLRGREVNDFVIAYEG
jgi:hypothetical protein